MFALTCTYRGLRKNNRKTKADRRRISNFSDEQARGRERERERERAERLLSSILSCGQGESMNKRRRMHRGIRPHSLAIDAVEDIYGHSRFFVSFVLWPKKMAAALNLGGASLNECLQPNFH